MKKHIRNAGFIALGAMLLSIPTTQAQEINPKLKQGTRELTVQGFADIESSDDYFYFLDLGYGSFIRQGFELGMKVGLTATGSSTTFNLGPFAEYNFVKDGPVVPYVHFGMNWINADLNLGRNGELIDGTSDALLLDGEIGVKYFLADNIAISTGLAYEWATEDVFSADDDAKDGNALAKLGMRFFF